MANIIGSAPFDMNGGPNAYTVPDATDRGVLFLVGHKQSSGSQGIATLSLGGSPAELLYRHTYYLGQSNIAEIWLIRESGISAGPQTIAITMLAGGALTRIYGTIVALANAYQGSTLSPSTLQVAFGDGTPDVGAISAAFPTIAPGMLMLAAHMASAIGQGFAFSGDGGHALIGASDRDTDTCRIAASAAIATDSSEILSARNDYQSASNPEIILAIAIGSASGGTDPVISAGTPTGTVGPNPTLGFTSSVGTGTARIVVDTALNLDTVTKSQILAGQNDGAVAALANTGTITLTGTAVTAPLLSALPSGTYTAAAVVSSGTESNILKWTFTVDADAPNFTVNVASSNVAATTFSAGATPSEGGSASLLATSTAASQPSNAAFDASAFNASITAATPFTINYTGAVAGALIKTWLQLKDAIGNRATSSVNVLLSHTGFARVVIGTPNTTAANRITATPADLVTGDILDYGNIQGTGTVVVNNDGTFDADIGVTAFDVYIGNLVDGWGEVRTQNVASADTTAPQFTVAAAIASLLQTSFNVTGTPNEAGEVSVIVTSQAASQPSDLAFDVSTERATMLAGVAFSVPHTGASANTPYKVWIQLKDQATTANRYTTSLLVTTPAVPDTTAPNFTAGIAITSILQTTANFAATPNEGGVYGLVILLAAAADPSQGSVLAGNASGAVYSRPQTNMSANVLLTAALTGMVAGQSYKAHAVLQDGDGNSRLVSSAPFTMATAGDVVDPTVSISVSSASPVHTFTASPSDNVGVTGVQFFVNGQPAGAELLSAPWQFAWSESGQPNGAYVITAQARDAAGRTGASNAIQIIVDENETPVPGLLSSGGPGLYKPEGSIWTRVQDR